MTSPATAGRNLSQYLNQAVAVILPRQLSEIAEPAPLPPERKLRVGVDLGTATLVLVVTDQSGAPLAGEWQFAQVVSHPMFVTPLGLALHDPPQ
jgi:ethanolamine utilization protein EutJ